jgi:hypothetical protein
MPISIRGMNDMRIFLVGNLITMTHLIIFKIEHLVNLNIKKTTLVKMVMCYN